MGLVPLLGYITGGSAEFISKTTNWSVFSCICSQAYLCYLGENKFGLYAAGVMLVNLILVSVPTQKNLLWLSSREGFALGLVATSFFLGKTVEFLTYEAGFVKSLW